MRPTPNKYIQIVAFFTLATLAFSSTSIAEKIFTWKDENGRIHYTNNEALVPLKNDADVIKMKTAAAPIPEEPPLNGQALWEENCQQCHNLSAKSINFKTGMPKLIKSINTPQSSEADRVAILQAALVDQMDDAINLKLTDEEVRAIVKYIRSEVIATAPATPDDTGNSAN